MDTCTSGAQRRGNRAIGLYDYIGCGEISEKVDCSFGSAWVGTGAAFDERGHDEVWGFQGGVDGHKISFSLVAWFSCVEQKIVRRVSSLIWVVLGERLAVVGGNCMQKGEGPVHRRRVLDGSS